MIPARRSRLIVSGTWSCTRTRTRTCTSTEDMDADADVGMSTEMDEEQTDARRGHARLGRVVLQLVLDRRRAYQVQLRLDLVRHLLDHVGE